MRAKCSVGSESEFSLDKVERLRCTLFPTWRASSHQIWRKTPDLDVSCRSLVLFFDARAKYRELNFRITSEAKCILTSLMYQQFNNNNNNNNNVWRPCCKIVLNTLKRAERTTQGRTTTETESFLATLSFVDKNSDVCSCTGSSESRGRY